MRLNGNQIDALAALRNSEDEWFHFDISGTDPLDKRVIHVTLWTYDYQRNHFVAINENGTVYDDG